MLWKLNSASDLQHMKSKVVQSSSSHPPGDTTVPTFCFLKLEKERIRMNLMFMSCWDWAWCFLLLNPRNQLPRLPILDHLWPDCQLLHVPANLSTSKEVCPNQEMEAKNVSRFLEHFLKLRLASLWHKSTVRLEESRGAIDELSRPFWCRDPVDDRSRRRRDSRHRHWAHAGVKDSILDCHYLACCRAGSSSMLTSSAKDTELKTMRNVMVSRESPGAGNFCLAHTWGRRSRLGPLQHWNMSASSHQQSASGPGLPGSQEDICPAALIFTVREGRLRKYTQICTEVQEQTKRDMIDCPQRSHREIMEIRQGGHREKGIHWPAFLRSSNLKALVYFTRPSDNKQASISTLLVWAEAKWNPKWTTNRRHWCYSARNRIKGQGQERKLKSEADLGRLLSG